METREIILVLVEASQQLKVLHWQTTNYAEHIALGSLYEAFEEAADSFAETLIGIDGGKRPSLKDTIQLSDYDEGGGVSYVKAIVTQLEALKDAPTDILNMRDSLLEKCHHTLYLLSLNGKEAEEEDEAEEKEPEETPEAPEVNEPTEPPPPAE